MTSLSGVAARQRESDVRLLVEVGSHGMGKKVIQFPRQDSPEPAAEDRSRIVVHVGAQRFALNIACTATALPPETEESSPRTRPETLRVETRFLSLRTPAKLGDRIDGWRVCWLGGWDKSKVLYKVMLERVVPGGRPMQPE